MNFKTITLLLLMLVIFTGCSSKNNPKPINRGIGEILEGKNDDLSKQEKIINSIVIMATYQKEHNSFDYFYINEIPSSINNAEDLIDYCFPASNTLTEKCNFKHLVSYGYKKNERTINGGYWDINKTLNDPFVLNYMNQINKKRATAK